MDVSISNGTTMNLRRFWIYLRYHMNLFLVLRNRGGTLHFFATIRMEITGTDTPFKCNVSQVGMPLLPISGIQEQSTYNYICCWYVIVHCAAGTPKSLGRHAGVSEVHMPKCAATLYNSWNTTMRSYTVHLLTGYHTGGSTGI